VASLRAPIVDLSDAIAESLRAIPREYRAVSSEHLQPVSREICDWDTPDAIADDGLALQAENVCAATSDTGNGSLARGPTRRVMM
jgi:hypothetical protein